MENILIIGAHPDDIELGCCATILKLKNQRKKVFYLVITNGGNWIKKTYIDRVEEQYISAKMLGVDDIICLGYRDGYIHRTPEAIDRISNIIISHNVDTVFCQYYLDSHQDHTITAEIVKSACMNCENLFYFESLTSNNFYPNIFVDVTEYELQKQNIIKTFKSQCEKYANRNQSLVDYVEAKDRLNGIRIRKMYAEGFYAEKYVIM